jgi:hypothetical protein
VLSKVAGGVEFCFVNHTLFSEGRDQSIFLSNKSKFHPTPNLIIL